MLGNCATDIRLRKASRFACFCLCCFFVGVSLAEDSCPECAKDETLQGISKQLSKQTNLDARKGSDLYSLGQESYSSIFTLFRVRVSASPSFLFVNNFFTLGDISGSCPVYDFNAWVFYMRMDQFCGDVMNAIWPVIRILILFGFSLLSFRLAFL
jgi:hypothetical protein